MWFTDLDIEQSHMHLIFHDVHFAWWGDYAFCTRRGYDEVNFLWPVGNRRLVILSMTIDCNTSLRVLLCTKILFVLFFFFYFWHIDFFSQFTVLSCSVDVWISICFLPSESSVNISSVNNHPIKITCFALLLSNRKIFLFMESIFRIMFTENWNFGHVFWQISTSTSIYKFMILFL